MANNAIFVNSVPTERAACGRISWSLGAGGRITIHPLYNCWARGSRLRLSNVSLLCHTTSQHGGSLLTTWPHDHTSASCHFSHLPCQPVPWRAHLSLPYISMRGRHALINGNKHMLYALWNPLLPHGYHCVQPQKHTTPTYCIIVACVLQKGKHSCYSYVTSLSRDLAHVSHI